MGMFDDILVPKSILQDLHNEDVNFYLSRLKHKDKDDDLVNMQTKDMECCMLMYHIKDGQLMEEKHEREYVKDASSFLGGYMKSISMEMVPVTNTVTIFCCDYLQMSDVDLWLDFKLEFHTGKLVKTELHKFEKEDAAPRIKRHAELDKQMRLHAIYSKTLRGRASRKFGKFLYKLSRKCGNVASVLSKWSIKF